ncbi:MAG: peptide deformylase [Candidatus Paceibacterota bacterium]|jgi:methionyl-tRNA formyltransferase
MKEIVQDGAPVLREVASPVPEELFGTPELAQIIADMTEALDRELEGVALAAPQIGVSYRIFIVRKDRTIDVHRDESHKLSSPKELAPEVEVYINPEILKTSRRRAVVDEGCLSVRGIYGSTKRHERVTLRARRVDGSRFERGGGGIMAQIFEHETDHLNGILFIDHAEQLISIPRGSAHPFIYFGTPQVASDTLEILIERGFLPSLVVTSPDAPKGRGLALASSETKVCALAHGIPVLTPEKLDAEIIATLAALGAEYAIVVAYGKIFPDELIKAFPLGVLNVHYSLLPKYRGATPLEAALRAGETETGVSVQKMVRELDAGDIIAQEAVPIAPGETARELRPRLIKLGATLLADTLPAYLEGSVVSVPQDAALASRSGKLKKEDGLLALDAPAEENWNKYRAYADSIGTYFFENGKRMKITSATFKNGKFLIERVIPEGKREIEYRS